MTYLEFFEAFEQGQRKFNNLDFEDLEGFSNKDFSGVEFENCFLDLDFRNSDLSNSKFTACNIKCIDLRQTNLTNALIKNCCVESAMFKGAKTDGFQFIENYCFGSTIEQGDFEKYFIHTTADILEKELTEDQYLKTFGNKMTDVTKTAEPKIYIWDFVEQLVYEKIVDKYVFENKIVELVYRDEHSQFDHILLPTDNKNKFVVIVVNLNEPSIVGFYRLDLEKQYRINVK